MEILIGVYQRISRFREKELVQNGAEWGASVRTVVNVWVPQWQEQESELKLYQMKKIKFEEKDKKEGKK
jgi:hypothetical protein